MFRPLTFSRFLVFFIFSLSFYFDANAQNGLGDPVINFTFGSGGAVHGPAVPGLSDYTFTNDDYPTEGSYTVMNNTAGAGNIWWATGDHSGNPNGYMLVMNTRTNGFETLFKDRVNGLCNGTSYEFGAYFLNLTRGTDSSPPDVIMRVEALDGTPVQPDVHVGIIAQNPTGPVWEHKVISFTAPPGVDQVNVFLINVSQGSATGNDIAIDDISIYAKGPLITSTITGPGNNSFRTTCADAPQTYTLNVTATEPGYVLQWQEKINDGSWSDIPGETNNTYTFTTSPTSNIYRYRAATSTPENIKSFSCSSVSNEVTILVKPLVTADVQQIQLLYFRGLPPIALQGSTNSINFVWSVAPGGAGINSLSDRTAINPSAAPNFTTTYILRASADANSCGPPVTAMVTVTVADYINVPNVFTPNNDGVNDHWVIGSLNTYPKAVTQIYNRNGQLLFRSVGGSATPWDGTYKGKNVPTGTYYYIIELNFVNLKYSGSLTVIR